MNFYVTPRRVWALLCTALLCLQASSIVIAQRQSAIWYFGSGAGLDFRAGAPTPLLDGAMHAFEGCATMSDDEGKLLFYTDGINVWNRQHRPMPNGTGLFGNGSSAQAAVAVPSPTNPMQFYVFTNDCNARSNGLRYSVVDMSREAGLGDIVQKNVALHAPVSEMVTAVRHQNKQAYWVLAHEYGNNSFRAYLIDANGVSSTPVISKVGTVHREETAGTSAIGCMKLSPDGKKLAVASTVVGAEVYDFNAATGQVSNPIKINGIRSGYGVEFSPSASLLYITTSSNVQLMQVNLKAGDAAAIAASAVEIAKIGQDVATPYVGGSLQLGPDGKLYVARPESQHLGVVQAPNLLGAACNYLDRGINLGGRKSMCGLPVFIQSFFQYDGQLKFSNSCFGEEAQFSLAVAPWEPQPTSILWNFGDPASGAANTSTLPSPKHRFSAPGTYTVKLTRTFVNTLEEYTIQFVIKPLPEVNLGPDRSLCPGTGTVLDATLPNANYRWSNGSTQATLTVTQPGTYWVEVTVDGCTARDEIIIGQFPAPPLELGPDRSLCAGETLVLNATAPGVTYRWQDGSTNPTFTVTQAGRYEVTLTNAQGCVSTDAVEILYKPSPVVNLGPDRVLCAGEPLVLGAAQTGATYRWQDGSTGATFSPTVSGTFWQEVTINGCTSRDEVNVLFNPLPVVNLGRDTTLCDGQTLSLNAARANATYRWQDGSTGSSFLVSGPGTYWVDVTNEFNCTTRDEIRVHYLTPPAIELGRDTTLCFGDTLTIGQVLPIVTYLWQDGSTQPTLDVTQPGTYRVTASLQHCSQTDVITVRFKDCIGGLFIPNIITPNGDGQNDTFFILGLLRADSGLNEDKWDLTIFDRWGKRIHHTPEYRNNWAAEGLTEGVYYYHLRHNQDGRAYRGWVEVVR